jgi:hypothetical protein
VDWDSSIQGSNSDFKVSAVRLSHILQRRTIVVLLVLGVPRKHVGVSGRYKCMDLPLMHPALPLTLALP